MKYYKLFIVFALVVGIADLKGQTQENQVTEGINYTVVKNLSDSTDLQGPVDIKITIAKSQFNAPLLVSMTLKNSADSVVFEKGAEIDLISGARIDSLKNFGVNARDFIFRLRNVPAQKYTVRFQVVQEDGNAFFVVKEEDWQHSQEGGQP